DLQVLRQRRDDLAALVGDDHEVLDPHADRPGDIDARLDRHDHPGGERVLASRGPSWTSRPTPCPRPWPKCSAWPASSMIARATASTSRPVGPGRTAASAASWAAATRS